MSDPKQSPRDWRDLTDLTRGADLIVERVRITATGIAIEGAFALPRLANLTLEDQVFVAAFVRAHGSIKEMEQVFGVSYPTIKARLNRLAGLLDFTETTSPAPPRNDDVIDRLARGEISPEDAIAALDPSTRDAPHEIPTTDLAAKGDHRERRPTEDS